MPSEGWKHSNKIMCLQTDPMEEIDETENRKTIEEINETRSRILSEMMKLINIQPDRSGKKRD